LSLARRSLCRPVVKLASQCRDLLQDLRYGARSWRRSPGFALLVVATLGLGIGGNAAIFRLLDAVLLRSLPVREPGRLVLLSEGLGRAQSALPPTTSEGRVGILSHPLYERLRADSAAFAGLAAQDTMPTRATVHGPGGGDEETEAEGHCVSANYFSVMGVTAAVGRSLLPEDETAPGANPVMVLSHAYWRRRFGGDPATVGRRLTVNGHSYEVVGVAAPGFVGSDNTRATDFWVPLTMQPALTRAESRLGRRDTWWLVGIGRLAPGVGAAIAQASVNVILQRHLADDPSLERETVARQAARIELAPGARGVSDVRRALRDPLLLLMAGVGLLLLIVGLNVSHLLLTRAVQRQREMSIRRALGASHGRLIRQLSTEGLLLAALGGGAALLVGAWLSDGLLALAVSGGAPLGRLELGDGTRVAVFTALLTLAAAALLGVVPSWRAARADLPQALGAVSHALAGGRSRRLTSRLLLASQVAFSLVLLVGAGMLWQTLDKLRTTVKGFDEEHLLLVDLGIRQVQIGEAEALVLYDQLLQRLAALPGVRGASLSRFRVLDGAGARERILVANVPSPLSVEINTVTPGYFDSVGMRLSSGRGFTPGDRANAPKVVVVNEALARQLLGEQDPWRALGRRFRFDPMPDLPREELEVVGVVADARTGALRASTRPTVYMAVAQTFRFLGSLEVRAMGDPALLADGVRQAVRAVHPGLPVRFARTMREQVDRSLMAERLVATLASGFGLAALLLVSFGLYGVISQLTAQRTREIGVRMALGATRAAVRAMVLRQAFATVLAGVLVGLPASMAVAHSLRGLLYGISPLDPATLTLSTLVMFAVATLAVYLPARRASRVDPMVALRQE
jgi:predicted permease